MFDFSRFTQAPFIIDFILTALLYSGVVVFLLLKLKRRFIRNFYIGAGLGVLLCMTFGFDNLKMFIWVAVIVASFTFVFVNLSEYRYYLLNNLSSKKKTKAELSSQTKEGLYRTIDLTVKNLSKTKTGAILTFEKNTSLNDVIKNGTVINAPVCEELLETIFYQGTRLHDGAVVIRGNTIIAASVYYEPTKRALKGKYGSRHRAAFGISETTDAVTVVVSEETGRISIAYKARMEACTLDNFYDEFVDYMTEKE